VAAPAGGADLHHGEPHCQPSAGPEPASGDWPRDRARWLDRAQRLLDRVEAAWPDDGLVDFLRADAARAAGDQEAAAHRDLQGRGKCTHMESLDLVAAMRDLGRKPPRVIAPIVPEYPEDAIRARVQGEVVLDLLIDPQGRAAEAVVVGRADRRLANAARAAARDGGYQAAMVGYYPVWSWLRVPVRFSLGN
jgi:TonB family protein